MSAFTEHRAAVRAFRARHIADRQASADADIRAAVDILARAMLGARPSDLCHGCGWELPDHAPKCWGPPGAAA